MKKKYKKKNQKILSMDKMYSVNCDSSRSETTIAMEKQCVFMCALNVSIAFFIIFKIR